MLETTKMLVSLFGITFLFGATWVFAVFTFIATNADVSFVSQLLFAVTNTLQGFFIFIFFVVLNTDARQAWQNLFCPSKKKKKPVSITSTSNKLLLKSGPGSSTTGTLSSPLPSFQSATLERNVEKYKQRSHELLSYSNPVTVEEDEEESSQDLMKLPLTSAEVLPKEHEPLTFSNPATAEEDEEGSSPDLTKPPLESTSAEVLPKEPEEESEKVKETKRKRRTIRKRTHRQSTRSRNHEIETVELDFGWSSGESADDEDI